MATELELLKAAKRNSIHAQMEIFDRFSPKMKFVCLRYLSHNHEAEVAMEDGFINAFAKINQVKADCDLYDWLREKMIASCIAKLFGHKHSPAPALENIADMPSVSKEKLTDDKLASLERHEFSQQELLKAANSIDKIESIVFKLFFIDRYDLELIGKLLKMDAGSVSHSLEKAKHAVQKNLMKQIA